MLGNVLNRMTFNGAVEAPLPTPANSPVNVAVASGVTLDARGLWSNLQLDPGNAGGLPYLDGGKVSIQSSGDVTLASEARIDVSSGAAVLANGKTRGGRGGDVTLAADMQGGGPALRGLLTIDGDIRGYGVNGGGTLKVSSGTGIVVGGQVLGTGNVLEAGKAAPIDLILLQDYQIRAGDILPVDYTYQRTRAMPGEAVGTEPVISGAYAVTLGADWQLPDVPSSAPATFYVVSATVNGKDRVFRGHRAGDGPAVIIPAGSIIQRLTTYNAFPSDYIVPASVFPNGFLIYPETVTVTAGKSAPADVTIASGTRVAAGSVFNQAVTAKPSVSLDAGVFQSGFSRYQIDGHLGVIVADDARLDVRMPVYRFSDAAQAVPTGGSSAGALELWTPPIWRENPAQGVLTQRGGASLVLQSTVGSGKSSLPSGAIDIRTGAAITVDPGQSITLTASDITVDGKLSAPGGAIAIGGGSAIVEKAGMIWIGDHAELDAAARAAVAQDAAGRRYGRVADGGTISIGGALDWEEKGDGNAANAFVVVRAGARLDASGTQAELDLGGNSASAAPVTVASPGGSIILKSSHGLYLDGTLRAVAGGAGAAGGTLALALASDFYPSLTTKGDVLRHREWVLAQVQGDSAAMAVANPTQAKQVLHTGTARLGVDRIEAGGFDNLSLLVDGPLSFDGNVALHMNQSLRMYTGTYAHGENAVPGTTVSLSAPYVRLAGATRRVTMDGMTMPSAHWFNSPSRQSGDGTFSVLADLIDIRDEVGFGTFNEVNQVIARDTVDRRGFASVELTSRGDIRLLHGGLTTPGNILLTAAQLYPGTGDGGKITAGFTRLDPYTGIGGEYAVGSVLAVRRYGEGDVPLPNSVFGSIALGAETVEQGGIVRAPLGLVFLGANSHPVRTDRVILLPGSITSVSAAGLTMPYGGTADGLNYLYAGQAVKLTGVGNIAQQGIQLNGSHVDAQAGAILDLSGGGTLTGAGFVAGRGGSVNILTTPLFNANPANTYSNAGNTVYAIVPGSTARYAPVAAEAGFGTPGVGQQITVPDGVPGLPAGTYTLMPSTYALLPGAFRVEIGAAARIGSANVVGTGDGSYITAGYRSVANTSIRDALPRQVIVTPAEKVSIHSGYDPTGYNAFVLADAARLGFLRGMLTTDAKTLDIVLTKPTDQDPVRTSLTFDGELRQSAQAGSGSFDGTVNVHNLGEVLASGQRAADGLAGASVHDKELSKLGAARLVLNGSIATNYGQRGRIAEIAGDYGSRLIIRSGVNLSAADIVLASPPSYYGGSMLIEEGASISTLGRRGASFDSRAGYVFTGNGVITLSNGWINLLLAPPGLDDFAPVPIDIGSCVSAGCNGTTRLLSEGTLAVATGGTLTLSPNVSYGTRNLSLALAAINLGEDAGIAAAGAAGRLPSGLVLNQGKLNQLLSGNTADGAPALETLTLNARDAVNIYGTTSLDASSLNRLVLGTPAIYGYGTAGDVASIRAGEFIWTGSDAVPGAVMAGALGDGRLDIGARSIVLGQGPYAQASGTTTDARLALGFADVRLAAADGVTSNGKGALSVYHRQGVYAPGEGYAYDGGNLDIVASRLTGQAGSKTRIVAGGDIVVSAPEGARTPAAADALGAALELKGRNIRMDGTVVLPSGRLVLSAANDLALGAASRIDLAGREIAMFDVRKYSWGGDLVLSSATGNITQAAGSVIDVSARDNRGGTVEATALGAGAGHVDLAGAIRGQSSGSYDAGGTFVPYDGAELTVRARTLGDFAGLNRRLSDGGVFGARRFQTRQGDLTVGDGVKAREVSIVVDGGNLTVDGHIDAAGAQVGTIRLAAKGDLTINGTLDAHGSGLRVDSYGKIIDSPNRAIVDLTAQQGTLTLGANARIDLRAGTEATQGNDGVARGTLSLNAARRGGTGVAADGSVDVSGNGANDVAVAVLGTPAIAGAKSIAVNAFRTYDNAPPADQPDVSGYRPQLITQAYFDGTYINGTYRPGIDADNQAFMNAALSNGALGSRLAGLGDYHLRPGVEIVSNRLTNPHGDLTIVGDLDLSGYRYGPDANRGDPARRGYGEPGALVIRAGGNLNIYGSVNDGFAPPAGTPDDKGWVLAEERYTLGGNYRFGGDVVIPIDGVSLDIGTRFPAGSTLNYNVPVGAMTLPPGTVLPVDAILAGALNLAAGTVVAANIYNADGSIAYAAGTVLSATVTLTPDMRLGAGTTLRLPADVAALTWPKGVALPVEMTTTRQIDLARGSLIPSMSWVELPRDARVDLRPAVDDRQGRNWAVAPMLGAGATSWDLQMVAGADLGSADRRALNPASNGAIRLGDTHYVMGATVKSGDVWKWTADNWFFYEADSTVSEADLGWCEVEPSMCYKASSGPPIITSRDPAMRAFSVVRTGTGDLEMIAAGDIRMHSLYGVYTAGSATAVDAAYTAARGRQADGTVIGLQPEQLDYDSSLATYRAWYPTQGGNIRITAGGNLTGDLSGASSTSLMTGNWLWRQGSGTARIDTAIPAAWWINFGTYIADPVRTSNTITAPRLTGFTGIGALGGGDVSIRVGGEAGVTDWHGLQSTAPMAYDRSTGLMVAVGSTGRVGADGALTLTGGGDIDMRIAGALNASRDITVGVEKLALTGAVANLRGATQVSAGSIGSVGLEYSARGNGLADLTDPRGIDPFTATTGTPKGAISLIPGDSAMYLRSLGDLVLGAAADPGRTTTPYSAAFAVNGTPYQGGGNGWFSLWTAHTALNLVSAGGNMTPTVETRGVADGLIRIASPDGWIVYPSIFRAAALTGSLYYGYAALPPQSRIIDRLSTGVTLAPSATGVLEMLAGGSIYAGQYSINMSGAGIALPSPFNPAFVGMDLGTGDMRVSNLSGGGLNNIGPTLFAFGPNSAERVLARAVDAPPIRFYAAGGDIVGLKTGETAAFPNSAATWYNAAAPVRIKAARDIVNTGDAPGHTTQGDVDLGGVAMRGNLIVHTNANDVSVVSAGRDILYANFEVAGPGTLEVFAGRNLLQEDRGGITSIGPIVPGDTRPGAAIALMAGAGAAGLDMSAIRARYLDPANRADTGRPMADQPGRAVKTYEAELAAWLKARYGFVGGTSEALAYFDGLAPEQQRVFLREVYYAELREGGREYNNPASSRVGSYLRGREMIATLFPDTDAKGREIARIGDITMFGGSGVRTNFGGNIDVLAPGGKIVVGVQGQVPPSTSGVMTQGRGDIRLFSEGSLLLGLSRIMTTFGGSILAWSERGDINAGRGSKTTVLFTPPKLAYDDVGNVAISPQAPSSGAGIATLAPLAEVPAGDVDLIAPLGTIDAGEAGIRVSGNVNLAALQVINAANIQVKGESAGIPTVAAVNVGALTNASAASSQAANAAQDAVQRERSAARQALPSIFTVRILDVGNEAQAPAEGGGANVPARPGLQSDAPSYDPKNRVQYVGHGRNFNPDVLSRLTDDERRRLQQDR
ncbi:filamentous hemagglutinin family protein [Cupriavidus basilensis]|uniref:Filamentous hemagglutinin family protein n=1 Tax=Cupriavidus basilensis TaxID=68895 RepID=A0ABT6AL12_9BURK|nr:filamentous haemagglutinin family protein [Cupriavidus basilensis]MDF3833299.1 filamentous hemagglutinin family protein [Cupriavidus basilensis]